MVLGRALLLVFKQNMQKFGVNGAGSNLRSLKDFKNNPVVLGLSIEGRKFGKYFLKPQNIQP